MSQPDSYNSSPTEESVSTRPVLKSIGAALAGYTAGTSSMLIWTLATDGFTQFLGLAIVIIGWYLAMFTAPCWIAVVLPTWLLLPADSSFWRPGWATLAGAVIGAVLMTGAVVAMTFLKMRGGYSGLAILAPVGAVIGSVTGLVSALLHRR
jgi:hypothetical protein